MLLPGGEGKNGTRNEKKPDHESHNLSDVGFY